MNLQENTSTTENNQTVNDEKQIPHLNNVCSGCGTTLKEGQIFCLNCGKSINQPFIDTNKSIQEKLTTINHVNINKDNGYFAGLNGVETNKDYISISGIISGIISVIFGIIMFTKSVGTYESSVRYGGDAYTGIQNAAAQTANNIQALSEITKFGFAFLLIAIGLIAILYFLSKLKNKKRIINKGR